MVFDHAERLFEVLRAAPGELVWSGGGGHDSYLAYTEEAGFVFWVDYRPRGHVVLFEWGDDENAASTGAGASIYTGRLLDIRATPPHFQLAVAGFRDARPPRAEDLDSWGAAP